MALRSRPRKNRRPQPREETLPERIAREQSTLHKDPRVLQSIQKQRDLLAVLPQHELTFTNEVREEAERICEVLEPFGFTFPDVVLLVDELGAGSEALTAKVSQLIEDNLDNPDGRKSEWISTTKKKKAISQKPRNVQARQPNGRTRNNGPAQEPPTTNDIREEVPQKLSSRKPQLEQASQGEGDVDECSAEKICQPAQSEVGERNDHQQNGGEDLGSENLQSDVMSTSKSQDAPTKAKDMADFSEGWAQVEVSAWSADDTAVRGDEQRASKPSTRVKTTSQTTDISTTNGEATAPLMVSPKVGQREARGGKKGPVNINSSVAPPSVTTPPPSSLTLQPASVLVEDMPTVTSLSSSQVKRPKPVKANWDVESKGSASVPDGAVTQFHSTKSENKPPTSRHSDKRETESRQSKFRQVNHQQAESRLPAARQADQVGTRPAVEGKPVTGLFLQRQREVSRSAEASNVTDVPKMKAAPRRQQAPATRLSQAASHPLEPTKCPPPARHEAPKMVENPPPAAHPVCIPSSAVAFHARPRPSVILPAHVESPPSIPSPNYCFGTYRWETQPAKSARGKFSTQKPAHYISHSFGSFAPPPFYPPPFPSTAAAAATASTTRRDSSLAQTSISGSRQAEGSTAYYQQQNVFDFFYQPTASPTAYYDTTSAVQKGQASDPFEQATASATTSVKYPPGLQTTSSTNQQNYGQLTAARSPMGPFGPAPVCRTLQQPSYNVRPPMILSYAPQYGTQGTAGTTATYAPSTSVSGVIEQTSSGSDDHQSRLWRVTDDAYTVAQLTSALQQQSLQHQSGGNSAADSSSHHALAQQRWRLKGEDLLHHPQHHSNAASSFIANAASSLAAASSHHFPQSASTYSAFAAPPPGLSTGTAGGLGSSAHQYGYSNADTFGLIGSRHFN